MSLGDSSHYTSTDKTNKNKYKRNNTKNTVQTTQNTVNTSTHITKTQAHYKTHKYTQPHITKQVKTNRVQVQTNTVQVKINTLEDIPKWNSYKYNQVPPVYGHPNVHGVFIPKNFTLTPLHLTSNTSL